ncbi:c-type cytochrome [Phnomibacter ginsenosidimutans]|uniref:C-type cytochrome n=1 Tax=Phnomibacter ginsenosidimutans TaxID=2676868 RepID=A0A6I6GAG1_9BACT|nr:c-type cytochrome [Phnomibacter ginsenosidimutans]QGW29424.1 c-type cytochrome [Phnomibacter ginsenosidimutans]
MSKISKASLHIITSFLFLFVAGFTQVQAQDGKALFNANCASCHKIDKDLTGPALLDVEKRWPSKDLLKTWIKNWPDAVKTGDPYAVKIKDWSPAAMTSFNSLQDADIEAILTYIRDWKPATPAPAAGATAAAKSEGDNSLLFGVITLVLALIGLILLQVNSNLRKLADEKDGLPVAASVPFYKNKTYIALVTVLLFVVAGVYISKGAVGLGRSKDYQPEQPIYYSHKVHAGVNQINCLYCHGGAQEGKHANIPSVNVCMNCHLAINEYKGEPLYTADGKEVNGTNEIKKLYEYAGFTPGQAWDPSKAKPIEWIKIHNLPDHVYFNHAQHVKAGQVACQTCHGEIQNMGEVKQFSDPSMGWCINCHRETKVQFKDNGFYSIYEKFHEDMKNGKMDSVTVEMIGGTECQKCHY